MSRSQPGSRVCRPSWGMSRREEELLKKKLRRYRDEILERSVKAGLDDELIYLYVASARFPCLPCLPCLSAREGACSYIIYPHHSSSK